MFSLKFLIFVLLRYTCNGVMLKKCCPEGYSVDQNFGYKNPSEFERNNIHCRRDIENEDFPWIPVSFKTVNISDPMIPDINDEIFNSYSCREYGLITYNLLSEYHLNNYDIISSRGFIYDPQLQDNGDLNVTVEFKSQLPINLYLYEGSYCVDIGFDFHLPVIMTCACPDNNCVQYCCGGDGQLAHLDTKSGDLTCYTTNLAKQWDVEATRQSLAPDVTWIPAEALYWRHRCRHSSHDFAVHDEHHEQEKALVVLKLHHVQQVDQFHIDMRHDASLIAGRQRISSEYYCIAPVLQSDSVNVSTVAFFCEIPEFTLSTKDIIFHSWFSGVGAVFTLLTLVVHAILPELRRGIKGVSLMAHCACMLAAYISLTIRPYVWSIQGDACLQLAYVLQFTLLSAFFWLNIRAIFIFTRFRSMETMLSRLSNKGDSPWVYPVCALYACAVPALVCLITWFAQSYSSHVARIIWRDGLLLPEEHKETPAWLLTPDIDDTSCWFSTPLGRTLYFSLPMGIVLLANLFMFVSTLCRLNALTRGSMTTKKDDLKSDTRRLLLFAKMFVLMGLTWSGEFLSFANYLSQYYWYLSTAAMTLRAVAVFLLFCCKKEVWEGVRTRICSSCRRDELQYTKDKMNEETRDNKSSVSTVTTKDMP